jgi:hypothetical protein
LYCCAKIWEFHAQRALPLWLHHADATYLSGVSDIRLKVLAARLVDLWLTYFRSLKMEARDHNKYVFFFVGAIEHLSHWSPAHEQQSISNQVVLLVSCGFEPFDGVVSCE